MKKLIDNKFDNEIKGDGQKEDFNPSDLDKARDKAVDAVLKAISKIEIEIPDDRLEYFGNVK